MAHLDATSSVHCGPGTSIAGDACIPTPDASVGPESPPDSGSDAPGWPDASQPAYPDGEATSYAIDPAHDNAQPNETIVSPLVTTWTATFTGQPGYPLVSGDKVVIAAAESQPSVRALDLKTGKLLWGPLAFGTMPFLAIDGQRLFATTASGAVSAFDLATGARQWTTQLTGQSYFGLPVATLGRLYVNGLEGGGTTYAIDGTSGAVLWTANTFDGSQGTVAVQGGIVYEAEACDQLSAFDAFTGHQQWFHSGNCTGGGGSTPSVYQGFVWERDWASGDVTIDTSGRSAGSFASDVVPAFHAGRAFYVSRSVLTAVDIKTSTIAWSFGGDGALCTSPVVAGAVGQVFVGSSTGSIFELDELTGAVKSKATGPAVICGDELHAISLGRGHLSIPTATGLSVF